MRLAPLVPLPHNSLRLRLAFLIEDLLQPPNPSPRPAVMSCWRLGGMIIMNLFIAACSVAFVVLSVVVFCFFAWMILTDSDPAPRWVFGIIFGVAAVCELWSYFRMTKRLHIFKRRMCPMFVLSI